MKKIISIAMALLMIVSVVPLSFAEEEPQAEAQTDYNIEGTNSFGQMVENALENEEADTAASFNISNVKVEGQIVTASFNNTTACTLVVAAYDEDTGRMLCSGATKAEENAKEASIELADLSAENIIIKAFLLDENMNALCKAYTFNELTKAYKEFMAKTISDFDEDRVINLDDSEDNNFLVLKQDIERIEQDTFNNVLASFDLEKNRYVFLNINSQLADLQEGSVFYYDSGTSEDILIIKISEICIDGETAIINGVNIALEDVFEYVKIDTLSYGSEFHFDESTMGEGVGLAKNSPAKMVPKKSVDIGTSATFAQSYTLDKELKHEASDDFGEGFSNSIKFSGSLAFNVETEFKVHIGDDIKEIAFTVTPGVALDLSVTGKGTFTFELGSYDFSPVVGVYIGFSPTIKIELTAEISTSFSLSVTLGAGYDNKNGWQNKCEGMNSEFTGLEVEGSIFLGVDLKPHAYVASQKFVKAELSGEVGFKLTASTNWFHLKPGEIHICKNCIGGDIKAEFNLKATIVFGEKTKFEQKLDWNIVDLSIKLCEFYWSLTFGQNGSGSCPFKLTESNLFNGHYYQCFDEGLEWGAAEAFCEELGGHLATITSEEEQQFIESLMACGNKNSYWLGGGIDIPTKTIEWITGEEVTYTHWGRGQPDNNRKTDKEECLMIYKGRDFGVWNDLHYSGTCGNERFFGLNNFGLICEWDDISTIKKAPKAKAQKALVLDSFAAVTPIINENNTVTKSNAVSGTEYVLLIVKDDVADDLLAADNVLYIEQKTAEKHMVSFNYALREDKENPVVHIYGLSQEHVHSYSSSVIQEPTCTQPGVMTYTCVDEDDKYTETIPATGVHVDSDGDGICDLCQNSMSDVETPLGQEETGEECQYCHKIHSNDFIGRFIKFFHNILYFFAHLFGRA